MIYEKETTYMRWWDWERVEVYSHLQPKQIDFLSVTAKFSLMWGAKWWGKSHACRARAVWQCMEWPGLSWLVLRRTYPEVEKNMINKLKEELPAKIYRYTEKNHVMKIWKSRITFWYCQNKNDIRQFQGIEYDFICIEEITQRSEEEFRILMSSLRTSKDRYEPNCFMSGNPWGIWHARVKRLFIDRDFLPNENPDDYVFIPATIYDNEVLMNNDPSYYQNLLNLPEKRRKAYLEWNRDVFAWQYFNMFNRAVHVIDPIIPRNVKKRIICLDYWYTAPSAVYRLALTHDDKVICYREFYSPWFTYKKLALQIKALTPEDEKIDDIICDPAYINKTSESNETTLAQEFASVWLIVSPGNNDRIAWWMRIRDLLNIYEDPNTKKKTSNLKICSNCINLIRTLPALVHDDSNVEDVNTKWEDHACFTKDTLITMSDWSQKKIHDIKIWEYVKTEKWIQKVIDRALTIKNAKIYEIEFANWCKLRATSNHKIYTTKWKKTLDTISYLDIIKTLYIRKKSWRWNELLSNLMVTSTTLIENILSRIDKKNIIKDFIKRCGNTITDRFQNTTMFITKIMIPQTTESIILNWNSEKITWVNMQKRIWVIQYIEKKIESISKKLTTSQKNGIDQKSDSNDIKRIEKKHGKIGNYLIWFAQFVGKNIKHHSLVEANTVTQIVKLPHYVWEEDVYNLTVENEHNYYANGILVANSDALRYWISILFESIWSMTDVSDLNKSLWNNKKDSINFYHYDNDNIATKRF